GFYVTPKDIWFGGAKSVFEYGFLTAGILANLLGEGTPNLMNIPVAYSIRRIVHHLPDNAATNSRISATLYFDERGFTVLVEK
ncbi:MAG: hypothetical protein BRD31_04020, partial [Bacteroidetes bacterium QH_2_64_26]